MTYGQEVLREGSRIAYEILIFAGLGPFGQPIKKIFNLLLLRVIFLCFHGQKREKIDFLHIEASALVSKLYFFGENRFF